MTSFSWIVRSLLRVTRKAAGASDPVAAEEGVEPGADHVLEEHEPALAVAARRAARTRRLSTDGTWSTA